MPDAYNIRLGDFFNKNLLVIPKYQRGYSWEGKHREDLWNDIDQIPEDKIHYFGSLLTKKEPGNLRDFWNNNIEKRVVVDGQQRCTSLFLLFVAMRDRYIQLGHHQNATRLHHDYIYFIDRDEEEHLRIKNNNSDLHNFLKNLVEGNDPIPQVAPENRLKQAKAYFDHKLNDLTTLELEDLFYTVSSNFQSTEVYLDQQLDEPTVFESVNNRGVGLSNMDQLKNYLILLLSRIDEISNEEVKFERSWFRSLEYLMKNNIYSTKIEDSMLAHYWVAHQGADYNAQNSFLNFKLKFHDLFSLPPGDRRDSLVSELEDYLDNFQDFASAYAEIESRSDVFSRWSNTPADNTLRKDAIELLTKHDNMGCTDPMKHITIASYIKFSAEEFVSVMKQMEIALFRIHRLANKGSNARWSANAKLAHEVYSMDTGYDELLQKLEQACINEDASLQEIKLKLEKEPNAYKWRGLVYFLHEYERSLSGGIPVTPFANFSRIKITIEHILPQQSDTDVYWSDNFDEIERIETVHRLGNLVLTENNSSYGNKSYPLKRQGTDPQDTCYLNGTTHQEKKLANDYEDWNSEKLESRHEQLVEFGVTRWAFPGENI